MYQMSGRVIPLSKVAGRVVPVYEERPGVSERILKDIPYHFDPGPEIEKNFEEWAKTNVKQSPARVLGHRTIAVREKGLPPLEQLGFRKTRLAVPLPGEKGLLPVSYRKGHIHAHDMGDTLLMHTDKIAPEGFVKSLHHGVVEGIPAYFRRFGAVKPVIRSESPR